MIVPTCSGEASAAFYAKDHLRPIKNNVAGRRIGRSYSTPDSRDQHAQIASRTCISVYSEGQHEPQPAIKPVLPSLSMQPEASGAGISLTADSSHAGIRKKLDFFAASEHLPGPCRFGLARPWNNRSPARLFHTRSKDQQRLCQGDAEVR